MATGHLNMAVCRFLLKEYQKSADQCLESLKYNKTIKAYYRLGQAYKALEYYDDAIAAYEKGVLLDVSDPNDIQSELIKCKGLAKKKEQRRL